MLEKVLLSYDKGITNSPSDMICPDGDLSECVNLEVKSGEIVPMEMPVKLGFNVEEGETLLLVHNTKTGNKNYVTTKEGTIKIFEAFGDTVEYYDFALDCGEVKSIQSVGNTIVVYTSESPHYILYSGSSYKYIGSKIPEVGLSFDLLGEFVMSDIFKFSTPKADSTAGESFQSAVCSELAPEINKFIEENSTEKGRFMYPFFVRYALRLFDGTHVVHSSPVLMLPSTNISPFVSSFSDIRYPFNTDFEAQIGAFIAQLEASVSFVSGSLSDWSDIVSSLDVFVSKQIVTYDQNGLKFGNAAQSSSKFIGKYNGKLSSIWDGYSLMFDKVEMEAGENDHLHRWYIPNRDLEEIYGDITNTSLFYKYTSIDLSSLTLDNVITLSGSLSSLEVGEVLKDDYMTHDVFVPGSSFVYNGRLNISRIQRKLFDGFPVQCMAQMVKYATHDGFDYGLIYGKYEVYTFIRSQNGGDDIIVKSKESTTGALFAPFLFYPDSDAYRMVIVDKSNERCSVVNLTEHPLLNGAFYFSGFQSLFFFNGSMELAVSDNSEFQLNKLYVSNVNNPFHFPLEGIYTVGSDSIIGMGAITRPISQGQFGEFPLIVFCSDGNYAMRVDEQGYYAAISPVQEDVVLGNDKIVSMEDSLAVITKKGIMLTTGGVMTKIAAQMDGGVFKTSLLAGVSTTDPVFGSLVENTSDDEGFLSYVYKSRMAFDYASNRLLVYRSDKSYSYMINLDNGVVTKMELGGNRIENSVLDYPDTIIQDSKGNLYSLYSKEDVSVLSDYRYGISLTRPLKMGEAMTMKSVRQIKTVESNRSSSSYIKYLLYGSNDNVSYINVGSRFGKPYKYYRLAMYTCLLPKESVSGTVVTIEKRRSHKLR